MGFFQSFTIELIHKISQNKSRHCAGFAYQTYPQLYQDEDLASFLKWFYIAKDWDDMLKFMDGKEILEWMLAEGAHQNWGENLGDEEGARKKSQFLEK